MKKIKHFNQLLLLVGMLSTFVLGCNKTDDPVDDVQGAGTMKDIDGNTYKTVKIGSQVWMAENLKTTKYNNGDEILIRVKYKTPNAAIDKMDIHTMSYSVTLVPEHEAEYKGGVVQMKKYLKENVINKIAEPETGQQLEGVVRFSVNEEGEIIDPKRKGTTNNATSDKLLLDAIRNMPKWKPATNSQGGKMKQDFEFAMVTGGC